MKKVSVFSVKTYWILSAVVFIGAVANCWKKADHFDNAWFAEQSYWLLRDGWVRSELFRGLNHWEERIYVFHKLYIYTSALVMSVLGISSETCKVLSVLCSGLTAWLIWKTGRRESTEQAWLAVILFLGFGTLLRFNATNRPEPMVMALGMLSFVFLNRHRPTRYDVPLAALFAGMAALTHLNGLIYLAAGFVWLWVLTKPRKAFYFGIISGLVASLYFLDALADGRFDRLVEQFVNDPATQGNLGWKAKLAVMLGFHRFFFHSERESVLSALAVLSLIFFRKQLRLAQPLTLYTLCLVVSFWLLSKSDTDYYYLLLAPWLVMLTSQLLVHHLPEKSIGVQRFFRGLLLVYVAVFLLNAVKFTRQNITTPPTEPYNAMLASHMPKKHTNVIGPLSFFFGQMENYRIHGLPYFYFLNEKKPFTLNEFFEMARRQNVEYVISDNWNMTFEIPQDAPARIGTYVRVFRDEYRSIYARY